jgi:oligopeptide transport system ATP-binding protein
MVFQDPMTSLNPLKTIGKQVQEAVELHQGLKGEAAYKAVLEALTDVGIDDPERRYKQYPHEFSGGMRQRVVIAIAVACRPKILICDEPTTALDVTIQAQILELIKAMQKKYDLTTIYITHDLGVVANVADRIAVMYAGDLVEIGTCDEVFYDPKHPYTWALLSSLPQLGVKNEPLYSIQGTPPNLFKEVKGDAFAPRNPKALKIDFLEHPEIREAINKPIISFQWTVLPSTALIKWQRICFRAGHATVKKCILRLSTVRNVFFAFANTE